jgi:hypothetical protein
MSHNSVKIGNSGPDVSGLINIALEDLSDIDLTGLTTGQTLAFNSASNKWTPSAAGASVEYIAIGKGESDDYANTGLTFNAGDSVAFYAGAAPRNTIAGAVLNYISGTLWVETFTLPAGTYSIIAHVNPLFSTSGYLALKFIKEDLSNCSSVGVTGATLGAYANAQTNMMGSFTLTSSNTIKCVVDAASGVAAAQSTQISQFQSLFIRKIEGV